MRYRNFVRSALGLGFLFASCGGAYAERRALVIGNGDYTRIAKVHAAVDNARALSRTLDQIGFEVTAVENAPYKRFAGIIRTFGNEIAPGDEVIVHYSGHGVAIEDRNYLLPIDIRPPRARRATDVRRRSVDAADLVASLRERQPEYLLLVLDASHENPLGSSAPGLPRGLARMDAPSRTVILSSAGPDETSLERSGDHDLSPFVRTLQKHFETPGLTLAGIANATQLEVYSIALAASHRQRPDIANGDIGQMVLASESAQPEPDLSRPSGPPRPDSAKPPPPAAHPDAHAAAEPVPSDPIEDLEKRTDLLYDQGRSEEAERILTGELEKQEARLGREHPTVARILTLLGELYTFTSRPDLAEPILTRALGMNEKAHGTEHPETARTLDGLAGMNVLRGDYDEAERQSRQAMAIVVKTRGAEHVDVVRSINILAIIAHLQKRYPEAERLFLEAHTRLEKALGRDHPRTLKRLDSLVTVHLTQGNRAEAEKFMREVLARREQSLPPDHLDVVRSLRTLGGYLAGWGRGAEAQPYLRRALEAAEKNMTARVDTAAVMLEHYDNALFGLTNLVGPDPAAVESLHTEAVAFVEKVFGPTHPETARKLAAFATFQVGQDRLAEAEANLKRAVEVWQATPQPLPSEAGKSFDALADLQTRQNRTAEAQQTLRQALEMREKAFSTLPASSPSLALAVSAYGTSVDRLVAFHTKNKSEAEIEALHQNAIRVISEKLGPDAPEVVRRTQALIWHYQMQKRVAEALPYAEALLETARRQSPNGDGDLVLALDQMRTLLQALNRHAEAEPFIREALALLEKAHGPNHQETIDHLASLANNLRQQGRHPDAEAPLKDVVARTTAALQAGQVEITSYLGNISYLERLYTNLRRFEDADRVNRDGIAVVEQAFAKLERQPGIEPSKVMEALTKVVALLQRLGRYAETESYLKRALAMTEKTHGPDHKDIVERLHSLVLLYRQQGRYEEAQTLLKRMHALIEKLHGPENRATANVLGLIGNIYSRQGQFAEAASFFQKGLEIHERADAKADKFLNEMASVSTPTVEQVSRLTSETIGKSGTALHLHDMALFQADWGHYSEAEESLKRSIAIKEYLKGRSHPTTMSTLDALGVLYSNLGRFAEAEALLKRTLQFFEEVERNPVKLASALHNLAQVYLGQRRYDEAEPLMKKALVLMEEVYGSEHPDVGTVVGSLGNLYQALGRDSEAELSFQRALAILERTAGSEHPKTARGLSQLGNFYLTRNRSADAEPLFRRSLVILEKTLGPEHDWTSSAYWHLGRLHALRNDWTESWRLSQRATAIRIAHDRRERASASAGADHIPTRNHGASVFAFSAGTAAHLAREFPERDASLLADAFELAQWDTRSKAATALAQTAARFARGEGELARLVRERQDLVGRLQALERDLVTAFNSNPGQRDATREGAWTKEKEDGQKRLLAIDAVFLEKFPEYAALANPEPVPVKAVQARLKPGEALYQVSFQEEEAVAWVITREAARWAILPVGEKSVAGSVAALRCGLDASAWRKNARGPQEESVRGMERIADKAKSGRSAPATCREQFGDGVSGGAGLPFDFDRAHSLYQSLFGPFEDVIKDKHLLVVPDGSLTALPLQVLVTAPLDPGLTGFERYEKAAWLARRQPITILPSVASLGVLRSAAGKSTASDPFAGFGNPLLSGPDGQDRRAWNRQGCTEEPVVLAERSADRSVLLGDMQDFFRGGLADVEVLRRQNPLPETADELCAVAASLGAPPEAVFLGEKATEGGLKDLSAKGILKNHRLVHFATHGLLARETGQVAKGGAEPALILTPPANPDERDDGLLTASEVAQLQLNAEWVILSACNTASGDGTPEAEAHSGLARSFLYAGARALLVSHWYVDSRAAVDLVTGTFAAMKQDPSLGRAEALRRAMLARISEGGARAHPSYWAPFVIIGEGG